MALLELVRKLPYNHPYRWDGRLFGKPKLWTPSEISTAAWYDAYDLSTIVQSGGFVSQWSDKSGNARHATQPTGTYQPKTGGSINGLNAIKGSGPNGNPHMSVSGSGTIKTCFGVAKVGSTRTAEIAILGSRTKVGSDNEFFVRKQSTQISFDGTSSTKGKFRVNGGTESGSVEDASDATVGSGNPFLIQGTFDSTTTLGAILGRTDLGVGPSTVEVVGEIIWLSGTASTADRQKLEGYLAWKWGLQGNLPAGHPYKSTPPIVA